MLPLSECRNPDLKLVCISQPQRLFVEKYVSCHRETIFISILIKTVFHLINMILLKEFQSEQESKQDQWIPAGVWTKRWKVKEGLSWILSQKVLKGHGEFTRFKCPSHL